MTSHACLGKFERPYVSRPSRTEQLENPSVLVKLKAAGKPSVEVPDEFKTKYILRATRVSRAQLLIRFFRDGTANRILEEKAKEREKGKERERKKARRCVLRLRALSV